MSKARVVSAKGRRSAKRGGRGPTPGHTRAARAWAKEKGLPVNDKGHLGADVLAAWAEAGRPGA